MGARGELIQEAPPAVATIAVQPARAWLLGYVRSDAPGYRSFRDAEAGLWTVPSGTYRFDEYVDALASEISSITTIARDSAGFVTSTAELYCEDRLGWLLGWGTEAGEWTVGASGRRFVPPGGIPLLGTTWTRIERDQERRVILDRFQRSAGYLWGRAYVWSCKLTMHRWALQALMAGWCLRGKVTLAAADVLDDSISGGPIYGALVGHVLGVDGARWLDRPQNQAEATLYMVTQELPETGA